MLIYYLVDAPTYTILVNPNYNKTPKTTTLQKWYWKLSFLIPLFIIIMIKNKLWVILITTTAFNVVTPILNKTAKAFTHS